MRLSKKKNCNRCRAYSLQRCALGYDKTNMSYDEHGFFSFGCPSEPCPKPLTNKDYCSCLKHSKKENAE